MHIEITCYEDVPQSLRDDIDKRAVELDWGDTYGVTEWAGGDWQVTVWEGETWTSMLLLVKRAIMVDGQPLLVGGIGSVMTVPEWRGRGHASAAMRAASTFIRDQLKAPFGLLICGSHRVHLYQSVGWQVVPGPLSFSQPSGKRTFPDDTIIMVYPCTDQRWPGGPIDLCGPPW
ncbi:MAG: GNAT family N-acetyltransferase [Anaerolineae bacterium]|nr:GNAT family N-acetyltransferase [Anaerolineae bacterium]